jgi:hypothetical protein
MRRLTFRSARHGLWLLAVFLPVPRPAHADPPPAPWIARDIGTPAPAGGTDVAADGVWALRGSGTTIRRDSDSFHFAHQAVRGDAVLLARFLEGGDRWRSAGLMARESLSPNARLLFFGMTEPGGLEALGRLTESGSRTFLGWVGPSAQVEPGLHLALQRAGPSLAGFYSRDGEVWSQADFPPQTIAALPEEALLGFVVISRQEGQTAAAKFDRVRLQPGAPFVTGLQACGGDRAVLLQWTPVKGAVGYRIYRGPVLATRGQLIPVQSDPVVASSFTDTAPELQNGALLTYAVAAILPASQGANEEGPLVVVPAVPIALPAGLMSCGIQEGANAGAVAFDSSTGVLTLRGSGRGFVASGDQGRLLLGMVEGDFRVTVRLLSTSGGAGDLWAAGIHVRETLAPDARSFRFGLNGAGPCGLCGLGVVQRISAEQFSYSPSPMIAAETLKLPLTLRLTRRGVAITTEYSTDDGQTYLPVGSRYTELRLPEAVYVGLGLAAGDRNRVSEATFSHFEIERL